MPLRSFQSMFLITERLEKRSVKLVCIPHLTALCVPSFTQFPLFVRFHNNNWGLGGEQLWREMIDRAVEDKCNTEDYFSLILRKADYVMKECQRNIVSEPPWVVFFIEFRIQWTLVLLAISPHCNYFWYTFITNQRYPYYVMEFCLQ